MELHEKNITSISIPDPSGKGGGVLHYVPLILESHSARLALLTL